MRGYGGILRLPNGESFMEKYDERLSLAPRDIVARAIDKEMKIHGLSHVCLDVTHKDPDETRHHFPNIYVKCKTLGIDITKDYIPVRPAAHYMCGGIKVDLNGCSSIQRLYAIGECSCTGLHFMVATVWQATRSSRLLFMPMLQQSTPLSMLTFTTSTTRYPSGMTKEL